MNFKRILIAVDNSTCAEKAAKTGYEMAELYGAEVALLNIVEPAPPIRINPRMTTATPTANNIKLVLSKAKFFLSIIF